MPKFLNGIIPMSSLSFEFEQRRWTIFFDVWKNFSDKIFEFLKRKSSDFFFDQSEINELDKLDRVDEPFLFEAKLFFAWWSLPKLCSSDCWLTNVFLSWPIPVVESELQKASSNRPNGRLFVRSAKRAPNLLVDVRFVVVGLILRATVGSAAILDEKKCSIREKYFIFFFQRTDSSNFIGRENLVEENQQTFCRGRKTRHSTLSMSF